MTLLNNTDIIKSNGRMKCLSFRETYVDLSHLVLILWLLCSLMTKMNEYGMARIHSAFPGYVTFKRETRGACLMLNLVQFAACMLRIIRAV